MIFIKNINKSPLFSFHVDLDHVVLLKFRRPHLESYFSIDSILYFFICVVEDFDLIIVWSDDVNEDGILRSLKSVEIVFRCDDINVTVTDGFSHSNSWYNGEIKFTFLGWWIYEFLRYLLLELGTLERILSLFEFSLKNFVNYIHFWVIM